MAINKNWCLGRPLVFGDQEQIDYIRKKEAEMEADEMIEKVYDMGMYIGKDGQLEWF